jgi:hypothetical protein
MPEESTARDLVELSVVSLRPRIARDWDAVVSPYGLAD